MLELKNTVNFELNEGLISKQMLKEICVLWKKNKTHSASEHVVYNILRGLKPNRGFSSISNINKLNNGMDKDFAYKQALYSVNSLSTEAFVFLEEYLLSKGLEKGFSGWKKNKFFDILKLKD